MIITLLLWFLITLTVFIYGISFSKFLKWIGLLTEEETDFYRICLLGLTLLSTLLASVSLFSAINEIVLFVLTSITLLQLIFYWKNLKELFIHKIAWQRTFIYFGFGLMVLLYVIKSVHVDNDTGLYHAQAIQWIEKYPAVPGLGNLYAALGNNIHFFLLSAFFSLSFTGTPFHVLNGWIVLFFCFCCLRNYFATISIKRKIIYASFIFIGCFLFRWVLCLPDPDITIAFLTWIIFILLLDYFEQDSPTNKSNRLVIIILVAAFILTIKLSFIFLFSALLVFTAYIKWRENKKVFSKLFLLICLLLLPWVSRSLIISGYALYPGSTFDIFKFSWRVPPKDVKKYQQVGITTWNSAPGLLKSDIIQELPDVSEQTIFNGSFHRWFSFQTLIKKASYGILLLSFFLTAFIALIRIRSHDSLYKPLLLIYFILFCSILFSMRFAPNIRFFYGAWWVCICIPIMLAPDFNIKQPKYIPLALELLPALIVLFFLKAPVRQIMGDKEKLTKYFIMPEPRYREVETVSFPEDNFQATRPKVGVRCWNENIPCLPCELIRVKMRGATFRDGFISDNP
jgi:hypothetical protein